MPSPACEAGAAGIAAIRLFQENDMATIVRELRCASKFWTLIAIASAPKTKRPRRKSGVAFSYTQATVPEFPERSE